MSNFEDLNRKLQIVESSEIPDTQEKPSTSGMSGDRQPRKAGRRAGRKTSKMNVREKLERSRQSARECRARKKLRYQYLEDLVQNREKAVFALRDELELYKQWCMRVDKGLLPLALLQIAENVSAPNTSGTTFIPEVSTPATGGIPTPHTVAIPDIVIITDDEDEDIQDIVSVIDDLENDACNLVQAVQPGPSSDCLQVQMDVEPSSFDSVFIQNRSETNQYKRLKSDRVKDVHFEGGASGSVSDENVLTTRRTDDLLYQFRNIGNLYRQANQNNSSDNTIKQTFPSLFRSMDIVDLTKKDAEIDKESLMSRVSESSITFSPGRHSGKGGKSALPTILEDLED